MLQGSYKPSLSYERQEQRNISPATTTPAREATSAIASYLSSVAAFRDQRAGHIEHTSQIGHCRLAPAQCSIYIAAKFSNLIQSISQFEQQLEIRPLGLVVKRITSITHNAMIRSLVRFWQRAAFFFANETTRDRFLWLGKYEPGIGTV
jgi:hypothetical protein